jgi:hypothetical protein
MRLALLFAAMAALAMMLGLMRGPSMHWHLALAFAQAAPPEQAVLAAVFDGLNTYLGNYIGEFLGELSFSVFFLLTSIVWLQSPRPSKWIGWTSHSCGGPRPPTHRRSWTSISTDR